MQTAADLKLQNETDFIQENNILYNIFCYVMVNNIWDLKYHLS